MGNIKHSFDLKCRQVTLPLSSRTHIMGILNVTPDSFSDGGKYIHVDSAVDHALKMVEEGADIIDIGGESTRPGSDPVTSEEEMARVIPVIQTLSQETATPISVDTMKSDVAEEAVKAGASLINDVSALRHDNAMAKKAAKWQVPVILMHMKGAPKTMQNNPVYGDVVDEIAAFLGLAIRMAQAAGIEKDHIVLDPGIGFGKRLNDNYAIIARLREFEALECPILMGVSRKSFIGQTLNRTAEERLMGTAAAVAASILNGAHIIRVHDVQAMKEVAAVIDAVVHSNKRGERS